VLPALLEPRVRVALGPLGAATLAQDGFLRPYDVATTLWPAGAALADAVAADCGAFAGKRVLELGAGVGAPSVALARCGARAVATDVAWRSLGLVAANALGNGVAASLGGGAADGAVAVAILDWTDDAALDAFAADWGPFDAVVGASLVFETWPPCRLFAVVEKFADSAFLAHAAAIDLGACDEAAGWALASAAPAAHLGLDEFATYAFERRVRAPSSFPPTEHPAAAEL
jgi:hypothetical protein